MTNTALKRPSPDTWLEAVLADFDSFLLDHAANERKASAMAMSLVAHYPDKTELVTAMIDLALEEMNHFRQVVRLITHRGLTLAPDEKDPYVNRLLAHIRRGTEDYFLDRLLCASVIEARGAERFAILAAALTDDDLRTFYDRLARSERNHHTLFVDIAGRYFDAARVAERFDQWTEIEDRVLEAIEPRARMH